jgi:DNA-directed RNA polymerase specialized sigma24 family protein
MLPQAHSGTPSAPRQPRVHPWSAWPSARGWDGFQRFFHDGYPRLTAQLHAITGDPDQARTAAQYAFAHAWRRWVEVAGLPDTGTWLRHQATKELSRPGWRRQADAGTGEQVVLDPASRVILEALSQLPSEPRRALVLADMARLSIEQVADEMDASTSAAHMLLAQARTTLARRLTIAGPAVGLNPDYRRWGSGTIDAWVGRQLSTLQYRLSPRVEDNGILDEFRTTDRYRRIGIGSAAAVTLLAGVGTAIAVTFAPAGSILPRFVPPLHSPDTAPTLEQTPPDGGLATAPRSQPPQPPHQFTVPGLGDASSFSWATPATTSAGQSGSGVTSDSSSRHDPDTRRHDSSWSRSWSDHSLSDSGSVATLGSNEDIVGSRPDGNPVFRDEHGGSSVGAQSGSDSSDSNATHHGGHGHGGGHRSGGGRGSESSGSGRSGHEGHG